MQTQPSSGRFTIPFTGCDAYFLAIEDLMERAGQGRHVGVTVAELGPGIDLSALRDAVRRFSQSHPLLHAKVKRRTLVGVPCWEAEPPFSADAISVVEHPSETELQSLCEELLASNDPSYFQIHVIKRPDGTHLVARWFHLLFDGRGAELALEEIARLAANSGEPARVAESWGLPFPPPHGWIDRIRATRAFVKRHYDLKHGAFEPLGGSMPQAGRPRFRVVHFSKEESAAIREREGHFTGGIFHLPYFFAAVARAHAAVARSRGREPASYYSPAPVQARKRWMQHPIFQNQVTVLFFKLTAAQVGGFETAVEALQKQFEMSVRLRLEHSFAAMLWWMRLLPTGLYREFLLRDTDRKLTSFFQSHTGEFMSGTKTFCGGAIQNGWHIPSVSQPPGTGIFFNDHRGRLTATISWRDGSLNPEEIDLMTESLRADLLGPDAARSV
jgi:hypothetical protein